MHKHTNKHAYTGYTTANTLAASGRSAGGLLMGAVANLRPDVFRAIVAGVPFVDVMTTMCDPSIPLTVTEWEEWGNPNEKKYFDYMLQYSPVDNVRAVVGLACVCMCCVCMCCVCMYV
jgi:oligopeptidase B